MRESLARRLWLLFESYHAVVYFAPEKKAAYEGAGLKGGWMGYFASRSAAMGPVPAEVVAATFYNFHPAMVRRAIPDAWRYSTPERVLAARYDAAGVALGRLLGERIDERVLEEAAEIAREAVGHCELDGRPLFAAHTTLEWPRQPAVALWHACTLLREHRGDSHVATLVAAGLDGCQVHVLLAADGVVEAEVLRGYRGWSEDEWAQATRRVEARGLLDRAGRLTDNGVALRRWIEDTTDVHSIRPWLRLEEARTMRFIELMTEVVAEIVRNGGIDFPNPIGLPEEELRAALASD